MALRDKSQRSTDNLTEEVNRLRGVHDKCSEIFGPSPSDNATGALNKINEAIEGITREIESRSQD
jgi:hypothetical protein